MKIQTGGMGMGKVSERSAFLLAQHKRYRTLEIFDRLRELSKEWNSLLDELRELAPECFVEEDDEDLTPEHDYTSVGDPDD